VDRSEDDAEGRPEIASRSSVTGGVNVDDFWTSPEEVDHVLEAMEKRARFKRNQRWENSRQVVVLFWFLAFSVILFLAMILSVTVLFTSADEPTRDLAKWVLETLVGGFIAGLIGFWAVKSFER
jgi:hypothetical protein